MSAGLINGANLIGGLIRQGQQTEDYISSMFDAAARRKAGAALATGDRRSAATILGSRGMLEDTDLLMGQATATDALTAYNAGDYGRARTYAAESGDPSLLTGIMGAEQKERAERAAWMGNAADALLQIPLDRRQEAFSGHIAPVLQAMGLTEEQLAQITASDLSDETLNSFKATLGQMEALDIHQNAETGEIVGTDKRTGKVTVLREGTAKPVNIPRGGILVDPKTGKTIAEGLAPESRPVPVPPGGRLVDPETGEEMFVAPERTEYHNVPQGGTLVATGGGSAVTSENLAAIVERAAPGARVTSAGRSGPENARAGGVPNSYHLSGRALDVVPPAGMSMTAFADRLRAAAGPDVEVINEGDHVHLEPASGRGGARVVAQGQDKPDITPQQARRQEADFRKEFNGRQEIKDFREVAAAYRNIQAAMSRPSAAGDLSAIFAYMKLLDPTSVVREQEFANAQNAAGVPDRIRNQYNRLLRGERLNPNQRADFLRQGEAIFQGRLARAKVIEQEYRGYAEDYGIDPQRVVGNGVAEGAAPAPTATKGPTDAQRQAAQRVVSARPPGTHASGEKTNPYVPHTQAEYNAIPAGKWVIDDDGVLHQKRGR